MSVRKFRKREKMKIRNILEWSCALCLSALVAQAQEANPNEKLEKKLKEMQESFDKQQREMRESFERMLRQQQEEIDKLKKQVTAPPTNAPVTKAAEQPPTA